ncbi:MAG: serine/threonine-protein kinase PknK, partial [Gammaproteobacteria bacterium]
MQGREADASSLKAEQWAAIQALFDATVEQPAAERAAYLAAHCPDAMVAAEVRKLIEADSGSQGVLDRLTEDVHILLGAPASPASQGERYRDLQWLGAGGMAVVYRARDAVLGRNVALKMLSPMLGAQSTAKARFLREAKAVSALDHPNICTVYDLGERPGGELFIAMALYEGETLAGALEHGPMPYARAVALTRQIARGLQYAHGRGIVHRDIKPSNIFLTEQGVAKILDFGIAKLADTDITQQGEVVGTLRYASPEQLAGQRVDHRTDIWSLGAVFYEILEGAPAFPATSPAQLMHEVALGERPPVSRTPQAHRAGAERLLDAMLSPRRAARFESAATLLAALDDSPNGAGAPAVDATVTERSATATTATGVIMQAQLRQGTAVFVELHDMSRLHAALDVEQIHTLLHRFASVVEDVAQRYGGRIHQKLGQSVSILFGVPVAHGNDTERALRAACEARDSVTTLGAELGHGLEVCVGVATGEFMSGHDNRLSDLSAGFVSAASALAAEVAAKPGEIWMTAQVHAALHDLIEADAGPGGAGHRAERAYRLRRLGGESAAQGEPAIAFVGRRAELRQLEGVLEECQDSTTGQIVLIRGEAGLGKTRLGDEIVRLARDRGCDCHTTRVYDFGVPQGQDTVAVLTHSLLGLALDAPAPHKAQAIDATAEREAVEADALIFVHELLGHPAPPAAKALYDAMDSATRERGKHETLMALLRHASQARPVLIRVEDIHWAERTTIGYLRDLVAAAEHCPIIVLLTLRPGDTPEDQSWRERGANTPLLTLDLAPLCPAEAKALASAFKLTGEAMKAECLKRAGGNPLFLEQLLRSAASQTGDAALPASVRSLVLERMDRLAPVDREALQLAALLGQRFALDDLRALLGVADYDCERLLEQRLVRRDAGAYLFAHALVQETAYASLLPSTRRMLHTHQAERVRAFDPALAAEHLERAGDAGAAGAYLDAGERASDAYRYEQALSAAERGLALSPAPTGPVGLALRLLQGELLRELGRAADSLHAFNAALDLAGTDPERSRAWIGIAASHNLNDERAAALEALEQAEAMADESTQLE